MKKLLLISTALLIGACVVNAQSHSPLKPVTASHASLNRAYPAIKFFVPETQFPSSSPAQSHKTHKTSSILGFREIGFTKYELQSNCAAPRNIINHGDGSLSFCWTIDDGGDHPNYVNRGSGYNYWTGSALVFPAGTSTKLETIRTGFSQIAYLNGLSKEVIFAHKGNPTYDFQMSTNAAKGSTTWTGIGAGATLPASSVTGFTTGDGTGNALWGRIATGGPDGKSIHLLANYYPGTTGTEGPYINGIFSPTVYSRSTDGGISWDDQSVMLPKYDTTRTLAGGGEAYAIDAEGSTVAIVLGGVDEDVALWKSTDNGATFLKTYIDSFKFAPSIAKKGTSTDTAQTSDGAVSVVVDLAGAVHVAYSVTTVHINGTTLETNFRPSYAGLVYWNDKAKDTVPIAIDITDIDGAMNGGNGNDKWDVGQWTTNGSSANGPAARYGSRCFLSIPSIAVDGNNVFIVFSLVTDADSTSDGQSYRDIWVVASADGGLTFGKIQNITCTKENEEFFSSLAKKVDNNLHILYDLDIEPGTPVQNDDPAGSSQICYAIVDKAKVLAGTASCSASGNGIVEHSNSVFSVANNYPNPTSGLTFFDVTMKKNTNISIEIFNNLGQQVYVSSEKLSVGKYSLSVDASTFSSGLYFYTIKSGDAVVSGKMTVVTE